MRRVKRQAELTKEMLASGSWKDATFKEYNFKTLGAPCAGGNLHPLLKVGYFVVVVVVISALVCAERRERRHTQQKFQEGWFARVPLLVSPIN